jgi:N6-adenosine-specific RNA methylase IME4
MMFDDLPRNHFKAILADPPWRFETWNKATAVKRRGSGTNVCAAVHYSTMTIEDICALPVADIAATDCCLFLWISWPMLPDALRLIKAWGFKFKTCAFDWMKAHNGQIEMFRDDADALMGMGYWTRANSEPCLLATRGNPKRLDAGVRMGIIEPRREHSRKPDCVHGRIERLVSGPYLELFARQSRPNWTVWGNQTTRFDQPTGGANVSSGNEGILNSQRNGPIPDGEPGEIARATEAIPIGDTGS